jgi:hypothetical protein
MQYMFVGVKTHSWRSMIHRLLLGWCVTQVTAHPPSFSETPAAPHCYCSAGKQWLASRAEFVGEFVGDNGPLLPPARRLLAQSQEELRAMRMQGAVWSQQVPQKSQVVAKEP